MSSTTTISHEKLARLIGTPACPVLIDVRTDEDFALDQRLIPSSRRRPYANIEAWCDELADKRQQGKKTQRGNGGAGVMAMLDQGLPTRIPRLAK